MNIFSIIIKIIACCLLMFFDLAAFGFGLSCLAGGDKKALRHFFCLFESLFYFQPQELRRSSSARISTHLFLVNG